MSPPKKRYHDLSKALRDNLLRRKSQIKARNNNSENAQIAKKNAEYDESLQCDEAALRASEHLTLRQ